MKTLKQLTALALILGLFVATGCSTATMVKQSEFKATAHHTLPWADGEDYNNWDQL